MNTLMFLTAEAELSASYTRMENTWNLLTLVCFGYAAFIIIRAVRKIIKKIRHK